MTIRLAAAVDQRSECGEKLIDVIKMKAGRRLVKNEKSFRSSSFGQDVRRVLRVGPRRPESVVADCPSRKYPKPDGFQHFEAGDTVFCVSLKNIIASRTVILQDFVNVLALCI